MNKTPSILIREIHPQEYHLLEEFLYEAIFIPEGVERPGKEVILRPELAVYYKDFGNEADFCLIAESAGVPVGAVWIRLFPEGGKGYGFVDAGTPEVCLSVLPSYRNKGIGTMLLNTMLDCLARRGVQQVSLSVDEENYAFRMYGKAGFETVSTDGISATMIKKLNT
jgi:ribosomal protein S18 acetylase RimI-like enzyme